MGVTLHNRIMRLHRAYMMQGYADPGFAYSTKACLDSAHALLDLVGGARELMRWWVVLVHVWTAGLVICADLHRHAESVHHPSGGHAAGVALDVRAPEQTIRENGIRLAIALMRWAPNSKACLQVFPVRNWIP